MKRHGTLFEPIPIAEELIRSADFPRAVRYCLASSLDAVSRISSDQGAPHRIIGRLVAALEYGEVGDISGEAVTQTLRELLTGIHAAGRGRHEGVLLEPRAPDRRARDAGGTAAAMWLTVEHVTRFAYDASINEAYSEIRLKPAHRDGQRCSSFALATEPRGVSIAEYRDRFGNAVHHFDVLEPHQNLVVTARSEVWTPEVFVDDEAAPSLLDRWDLLRESRYVPLEGSVAELAATVDSAGPTLETAHALMTRRPRRG